MVDVHTGILQRLREVAALEAAPRAGLVAPGELKKIWDINGTLGGPLLTDRLWYVVTSRYQGTASSWRACTTT